MKRGKETVLNISKRKLTNAEYRLLGKGLKFCTKPKHHDVLQLKQDIFEFTRKLRLKEFFNDKEHDDDDGGGNNDKSRHNCYTFPKEKNSTFIPPTGRDSTLEFYIEAITHEILQNNKTYRYGSNLSHEEQTALTSLRNDDNIVIKKSR